MSWILTLVVAVLTAVFGLCAAGAVAALAVDWYRISSFEGGSGFFVVFMALAGGAAGFLIGLIGSRVVAARPKPGFLKALGVGIGVLGAVLVVVGGTARLLADIPPEIDGETLTLLVEVRWPAGPSPAPAERTGVGRVWLGRAMGKVVGRQEDGPLFVDLARQENGRWIVPGAVPIFTGRGQRVLSVAFDADSVGGFIVPLPGRPSTAQRQWSDWLPHAKDGQAPLPDGFTYRFRVARASEPIREDVVGPFRIGTIANDFFQSSNAPGYAVRAVFNVRYRDAVIPGLEAANSVAVVGGPRPVLLAEARAADGTDRCLFVTEDQQRPTLVPIGSCNVPLGLQPVTSDSPTFHRVLERHEPEGWLDRTTLTEPGLYRLDAWIVDTRDLTAVPSHQGAEPNPLSSVPPLTLSPDAHSFVWLGLDGSEDKPRLGVTNFRENRNYALPIRREVMRYSTFASLDPAWVAHHFEWQRGSDGYDVLHERAAFEPLPYRGDLEPGRPGEYLSYTIRPGGEALRDALLKVLVETLGAERLPDEPGGYLQHVRLEGHQLRLQVIDMSHYVALSMDQGEPAFMTRLAQQLDAEWATRKYDEAFVLPREPQ
ncbi:MAG: hypothetical protein ABIX28_13060 [Vicinamibacterales bacterium]